MFMLLGHMISFYKHQRQCLPLQNTFDVAVHVKFVKRISSITREEPVKCMAY